MKSKKLYSTVCAAVIATTMLVQVLFPSVVLAAKMTDSDANENDVTVETSVSGDEDTGSSVDETLPVESSSESVYSEETTDVTIVDETESESDETNTSASDTDPTDEILETEETEETAEEIEYVIFDHYFSDIDDNLVRTSDLFVITSDSSVFTRNTNVVSNYDDAYIIECESLEEARFVYSYYVDKVDFITDLSDVASVANADEDTTAVPETSSEQIVDEQQEPDLADLSDLNNGNDAIANLNDIDTVHVGYEGYIALIDTGADADINYSVIGDDTSDTNGHGTDMLGYIREENPDAQVVSIKVSEDGHASAADIYAAFRLAIDLDVSYINFSMTAVNIEKNAVIRDIIQEALDAGIVVIGAAGNNAISATHFIPGCIEGVITVGAVDEYGIKIRSSNYNADLYVIANSTSEATARYTGLYTAGLADSSLKVFDQVEEDDDYVPDDYSWAADAAQLMTEYLQETYGYGCVVLQWNEDGTPAWRFVMDETATEGFVIAARQWDIGTDATTDLGDVTTSLAPGTYNGTCVFTNTDSGKGYVSSFDNAFGAYLNSVGAGNVAFICSKYFSEVEDSSDSAGAASLASGTVYYEAVCTDTGSGRRILITISDRADMSQPDWSSTATGYQSYTVSYVDSQHISVNIGGRSQTFSLTEAASRVSAAISTFINDTVATEYSGKKGVTVTDTGFSAPASGSRTCTATYTYNVASGSQVYAGLVLSGEEERYGAVSLRKIDGNNAALSGAVIYFVCTDGEGLGHESELSVRASTVASYGYVTYDGHSGVQFVTNGNTVTIEQLYPNSTYIFHEYSAPEGYDLAPDQRITTDADGNVNGDATITMIDGSRALWGSIGLTKNWLGSSVLDGYRFWNSVQRVSFSIRGSWTREYMEYYRDNRNGMRNAAAWAYGTMRQESVSGTSAHVYWDFATENGQYIGPVNTSGPSYYQYLSPVSGQYERWGEGAATCLNYLPRNLYYVVMETWTDGQFWEGDRAVYINTLNASGWHELSYNATTGTHEYVAVYYIDDNGATWFCDWNTLNPTRRLTVQPGPYDSIWEDEYYIDLVTNDTLTGALDVTKIDETGNGVDGMRFEVRTADSNNSLIGTGTMGSISGQTPEGFNIYNVNWNYTILRQGDFRYWHNDNGMPVDQRIGGYTYASAFTIGGAPDERGYEYNLADFSWPIYMGGPGMQYIDGVNYYSMDQFLSVYDDYVAHPENYTTNPNSIDDWRAGRNMVPAYFVHNFNRQTLNMNEVSATNADSIQSLNYGSYYIYEYIEDSNGNSICDNYRVPENWEAYDANGDGTTDAFRKLVVIDDSTHTTVLNVEIANRQYAINVTVNKVDEETGAVMSNYTGSHDATFALYYDANNNGVVDAGTDILIDTIADTDRDGTVHFFKLFTDLPAGVPNDPADYPAQFVVIETVAPDGYYLNAEPMVCTLTIDNSFKAQFSCVDTPFIELNFGIDKYDEWTDSILNGYSGSHDATFELWVDVDNDGAITSADRLLDTLTDTDRDGRCDISYTLDPATIAAKFPECYVSGTTNITGQSAKNYPVHYLVRETVAPFDFYLNETLFPITLNGGQYAETASRVRVDDTPYTVAFHIFKVDGDTSEVIRNAQFTIYNDVDGNKAYTEGVDTVAQTWSRADGLHNAQIVWNMAQECYVSSPLRSGNYVVVETGLPSGYFYVDANGQPTLARNEVYFEVTPKDVSLIGSTTPLNDVLEGTVYNLKPSIATTFHDPVTMSQTAHVDDDIELIDTVSYSNLIPNVEVRLDAVVMVKETGMPLLDANGNPVTGYRVFTPSTPNGTVDVSIHLDTNYVMSLVENGALNAPVDLVCFETLSFTATTDLTPYHQWYDENPIAEHKEIGDLGQTVRVAEIHTGVYDNQTLSQVASTGPNGDGYAVIVDRVHYQGLQPNHEYVMRGEMHLLTYDADGNAVDGGVLNGADSREILHPTTTFTPTEQEGYVDVTYIINTNRYRGQTTVSFEYCEDNGRTIVFHEDIEDLPQTLFIPDVHTNAYCPDTTPGEMGRTVIGLSERARIVDEVSYSNLLVDGREYMVQGTLYWMYQDDNGNIHSGPMADLVGEAAATATIRFKPEEHGGQNGTVEMTFTFDSTVLADLHYDRLVVCETIFANGGIGWKPICHHWDFKWENNSQSIYVPDVHTTAFTEVGTTLPEGQMPDIQTRVVTDRVYYENLIPNTEYTVVGNVQYAMVDENGNICEWGDLVQNGQAVTGQTTFVPTASSGYVDVTFTVDVSDIMAKGYDKLVCFESVYSSPGIMCAIHADISDSEQDIDIPELHTTALGANGRHNVQATANTVIVDQIAYSGLTPGRTYRMETDLMSSKTHESIAHVTTLFTPTESSGVLVVSITADLSGYTAGDYVVVFEDCYDNETNILIKSHHNWEDTDQTVETGGGGDTGVLDINANKYLYCAIGCVLVLAGLVVSENIKRRRILGEQGSSDSNTET